MRSARTFRIAAWPILLIGAVVLVGCESARPDPAAPTGATTMRIHEGAVISSTPSGEQYNYFMYVPDSVFVVGDGLRGDTRVAIPHDGFLLLLRSLRDIGALRDTVALRYLAEVQFDPTDSDYLTVYAKAHVLPIAGGFGLLLALGTVGLLYRRVRRKQAELALERALRRSLAEAREAERAYFARELHDGPVQDLCTVQFALGTQTIAEDSSGENSAATRTAVNSVIAELRGLCDHLRPPSLAAFGLPTALEGLAERTDRQHLDLRVDCRIEADDSDLSDDLQLALFRIAQEALTNVARHAQASRAELTLTLSSGTFRLTIDDDGVGPPQRHALDYAAEGHYGLLGMRERAELLGAPLVVERSPLGGTRVAVARTTRAQRRAIPAFLPAKRLLDRRHTAPTV